MTALQVIVLIESAKVAADLFGDGSDIDRVFRRFAKHCHPDVVHSDATLADRARAAFEKLTLLRDRANGKTGSVKIGSWDVGEPLTRGSIASLYTAYTPAGLDAVFKIANAPANNDLLERERDHLKLLWTGKGDADKHFQRYLPRLLDSFGASGRRVNVLSNAAGAYSLAHLRSQFPNGVPFRHIVWMVNRALSILGYAHQHWLVHGAVLPQHLLYYPDNHGLCLVDWTASAGNNHSDERVAYRHRDWLTHYPVEVSPTSRYRLAQETTDVYMLARAAEWAADAVPDKFRPLLAWCKAESPNARPGAWEAQDRWEAIAKEVYGPPSFVPFVVPTN